MGGSHEATPVSQPVTKGGSGQFGGKGPGGGVDNKEHGNTGSGFGGGRVTFDAKGNRLVDGKIQEGKGGSKIFAGTANENAYLAERGLSNKGTVFDKGLFAKSDIAKEQQTKESVQTSSLFSSGEQAGKNQQVNLSESFVFSDKVKPQKSADVVLQPYEKSAFFQPKANAPTTGGVETPQSKALGSTYSWENLGKESGVIFFTRDSKQEQQAKKSEESRASTIFTSQAKPEPKTDTTYGGPATKESAGQAFGTGDRLVRDSPFERSTKTKEAERATQTFNAKSQEKNAFFASTPSNKPSSGINIDPLTGLPIGNTKAEKQARENYAFGLKQSTPQTATPFQDVSGKGSTKTEWSLDIGEGLGFGEGGSLGVSSKGPSSFAEKPTTQTGDISNIGAIAAKGGVISVFSDSGSINRTGKTPIFNTNQNLLGVVSGPNAQSEFGKILEKSPKGVSYSVFYPQAEKEVLSAVKSNTSFYENLPNSYYQNLGKSGFISEKGSNQINTIFKEDYFTRGELKTNPLTPSQKANLAKGVNPLELSKSQEQSYTGHYVDTNLAKNGLPVFINQELNNIKTGLSGPVSIISPWIKYGEFGKNFAAFFVQGAKSSAIVGTALLTEGASLIKTGKATDKTIARNPSAFMSGVYYPQDLWSSKATENAAKVQSGIHTFAKSAGISGITPVENAQTFGATAGTLAALGISIYGFKGAVPFRVAGIGREAAGILLPKKGEIVEGVISNPIMETRPFAKSLVFGYGGKRSVSIGGRASTGEFYAGTPKPEKVVPNPETLLDTGERGFKLTEYGGTGYGTAYVTSKPFLSYLATTKFVPVRDVEAANILIGNAKLTNKILEKTPPLHETFGEKPFRKLNPVETKAQTSFFQANQPQGIFSNLKSSVFDKLVAGQLPSKPTESLPPATGSYAELPEVPRELRAGGAGDVDYKMESDILGTSFAKSQAGTINKAIDVFGVGKERNRYAIAIGRTVKLKTEESEKPQKITEYVKPNSEDYGKLPKTSILNLKTPTRVLKTEGIRRSPPEEVFQGRLHSNLSLVGKPQAERFGEVAGTKEAPLKQMGKSGATLSAIGPRVVKDVSYNYREMLSAANKGSLALEKKSGILKGFTKSDVTNLYIAAEKYRKLYPEIDVFGFLKRNNEPEPITFPETPSRLENFKSTISDLSIPAKTSPSFSSDIFSSTRSPNNQGKSVITSTKSSQYSVLRNKSSLISGQSKKSNLSSLSGKSQSSLISNPSSIFGKSGKSSSSGISGKSKTSSGSKPRSSFSPSTNSIYSGSTGPSVSSSSSRPSGSSGSIFSGGSTPSVFSSGSVLTTISISTPQNKKLLPPWLKADLPRKRKVKRKYGPTALYKFDVNNIFASDLNITIPANRRFEF